MGKQTQSPPADGRVDDLPCEVELTGAEVQAAFSALRGLSNPARDGDKAKEEIRPDYLDGHGAVKMRVFQMVRAVKPEHEVVAGGFEDARMAHALTDQRGQIHRDAEGNPVLDEKGYFEEAKKVRTKKHRVVLPDGPLLASHLGQELVDAIPNVYLQDLGPLFEWDQPYEDLPESVGNRAERRRR